MNKARQIKKLKQEAKKNYIAYHELLDKFDCGETLALNISGELTQLKNDCNKALNQLHELGEPLFQI